MAKNVWEAWVARGRAEPFVRRPFLAAMLALTLGFGVLAQGAVLPWERGVLHVGVIGCLALCLRSGVDARILFSAIPLAGALFLGFVKVPASMASWLAPGQLDAFPRHDSVPLGLDPWMLLHAFSFWILMVGFGSAASGWLQGSRAVGRRQLNRAVAWSAVALALYQALHGVVGWTAPFGGLWGRTFGMGWGPLVNINHSAVLMVGSVPFVVRRLTSLLKDEAYLRALPLVATLGFFVMQLVTEVSISGLVGLVAVAGVYAWRLPFSKALRAGGLVVVGACSLLVLSNVVAGTRWWVGSAGMRWVQYQDTLAMIRQHLWFGSGGGTYVEAFRPFDAHGQFYEFNHVHSDPLEWVAQYGLVGGVALAMTLWRWPFKPMGTREPWTPAVVGVAAIACFDFPLQIPGVALFGMLLLVGQGCLGRAEWRGQKGVVWILLGLNLFGVVHSAQWQQADGVSARLAQDEATADDRAAVTLFAPQHPLLVEWAIRDADGSVSLVRVARRI